MLAAGTIRDEFSELFDVYTWIAIGIFALVVVLTVTFAVVFRSSGDELPKGRHKNMPLELSYVALLACVVGLLVYLTYSTMDSGPYEATAQGGQPAEVDPHALPIDVTASRWNWRFSYPQQGVVVQGTGGRTPTLTVPQNRRVTLRMRSTDVIHAIWIPELRFKQDVFPGFTTTMTVVFPNAGLMREGGECNQFCGLHHADMDFDIDVLPAGQFDRWATEAAA
ncbi:MAG TPA: cytochrome c oxidase subunit II [Capillimicrobium sp.]|nr:cytochrome c oxidase subunit II [Capillimicrobium sp.]